jgi:hypothetical protein
MLDPLNDILRPSYNYNKLNYPIDYIKFKFK